tara:strand:- start:1507 stop:2544 length:1038 start_codon:yes stop_codon:yes gene_type:complete
LINRLQGGPRLAATITTDARQVDPAEVARFLYGTAASYGGPKGSLWDTFLHPEEGGRYGAARADVADKTAALPTVEAAIATDARQVDPREVARYARILTANRLVNPDPETWQNTGRGGYKHGGADFCTPAADLAARFADAVEVPGAAVVDDARAVDPREVARWSWIFGFAYNNLPVWDHGDGLKMGNHRGPGNEWREQGARSKSGECATGVQSPAFMVDRFQGLPQMPAALTEDARAVDPPQIPPGVVVYIDPPYVNCTGYAHAFPRSEWLLVVRRWVEAGALVVVSEAEPIPELMAEGWYAVEITGERKGQKRTFSKQQREWLTMSRPPAWKPSEQMGLFNGRS